MIEALLLKNEKKKDINLQKNAQLFILKYGHTVTGINYRSVKDCSSHDTQIVLFLKDLS